MNPNNVNIKSNTLLSLLFILNIICCRYLYYPPITVIHLWSAILFRFIMKRCQGRLDFGGNCVTTDEKWTYTFLYIHCVLSHSGRVWKMNSLSPEVALSRISPELRPLLCSVVRNGRIGLDSSSCLRITDLKSGWVFCKLNKSITFGKQCVCKFSKLQIWLISWTEIDNFLIKILSQILNQNSRKQRGLFRINQWVYYRSLLLLISKLL